MPIGNCELRVGRVHISIWAMTFKEGGSHMVVLSRKSGEEIIIGDDVVVSVVRVQGNRVQMGIEAPDNIRIIRSEIQTKVLGGTPVMDGAPSELRLCLDS